MYKRQREAVNRARAVVDALVANNKISYAITTGVGKLSDVHIVGDQVRELQVNLVRSHAVGVGEPLSIPDTRAMMLLRANSLAKGNSGVRAITIDTICEMLNRGVTPMVPSQGSVGASGDLAPLAHLALALIGEGECFDEKGTRLASGEALKRAQIKPLVLEAKEAVSLINGTQAMLAIGVLMLLAAETLVDTADVIGAMACDALKGTDVAFDDRIQKARPHAGQIRTAANLRRLLEQSEIRQSHRDCGREMCIRDSSAISGTVDFREPSDEACLARIQSLIEKWGYRRQSLWDRKKPVDPVMSVEEIYGAYDASPARPYDMKEILARIVDESRFDEYLSLIHI